MKRSAGCKDIHDTVPLSPGLYLHVSVVRHVACVHAQAYHRVGMCAWPCNPFPRLTVPSLAVVVSRHITSRRGCARRRDTDRE